MTFDLNKIREFFPFDSFRDGQKEAIEFILKSFDSGKRVVVFEGPTGSGKSAIGMTVARFFDKSYYLTIQKFLQTQIMKDFGSGQVVDLKGRSSYTCTFYANFGAGAVARKGMFQKDLDKFLANKPDCNNGYCRRKDKKRRCDLCFPDGTKIEEWFSSTCPYYKQIYDAITSKIAVLNYSSFLYQANMAHRFGVRDLLLVDEAHQSESQLLDFISVVIDDKKLQKHGFKLEEFELPEEYWLAFLDNNILSKVQAISELAEENEDFETADEYVRIARRLEAFYASMEDKEEWVAEFRKGDGYRTVTLKPVFVHSKSHQLLFDYGKHILLMSATILDVDIFCSSLGIPRSQVAAYRMKSRFPVENRPIYVHSAGRIVGGAAKMHEWAPKLVQKADEVLDKYPDVRGIIHTHNFAIADLLMEKSRHRSRFLYQKKFSNKDVMLQQHSSSKNTLIVAPAMHEGLDLYGDLSRIQIIAKIPWPNFFENKQLARRVELDRRFLIWITALKLLQSTGRSVRSETDWAHTYVLDGSFDSFIKDAGNMIPNWFLEAIQVNED